MRAFIFQGARSYIIHYTPSDPLLRYASPPAADREGREERRGREKRVSQRDIRLPIGIPFIVGYFKPEGELGPKGGRSRSRNRSRNRGWEEREKSMRGAGKI